MDPKELFQKSVDAVKHCIESVHEDQLANSTPCSEWDLRQLLNHIVYELRWVPELLEGKTIAEVGDRFDGDLLGTDPLKAWQEAADAALAAVAKADLHSTVHLSYGDFPATHYIAEMASDVLIHGWDVGQSISCSLIFDDSVLQAVYDQLAPTVENGRKAGMFAAAVEVSDEAPLQTRLLAMVGRRDR